MCKNLGLFCQQIFGNWDEVIYRKAYSSPKEALKNENCRGKSPTKSGEKKSSTNVWEGGGRLVGQFSLSVQVFSKASLNMWVVDTASNI